MNMKKIKRYYQAVNSTTGKRDCKPRWGFINKYLTDNVTVKDIGSSEGYFCKQIIDRNKNNFVYSYEAASFKCDFQKKYIISDRIEFINKKLVLSDLDDMKFTDYTLLLSVIHWFNPEEDLFLKKFGSLTDNIFIELPALNDVKSYNVEYISRIHNDYGSIDNYLLVMLHDFEIVDKMINSFNEKKDRYIYYLKRK